MAESTDFGGMDLASKSGAGIKPRHSRQVSEISITNSPEVVYANTTTSRSYVNFCLRCCRSCRQTMRSHKFWMGFTASTWGFLSSVERAVILPTLYLYLKQYWSLEAANMYYGITMAAFSLSILVVTPLYGYAAYVGVRVKSLLLFANFMEIIGNLVYLFAPTPFAVLLGRLISGIGASCEPPLYADIARATNRDERTAYIIVFLLTRQIGLIFGPSITLLMDKMDYRVANFTLSVYNGPGLLMAILWLLHSGIIFISYPIVDRNGRLVMNDVAQISRPNFIKDKRAHTADSTSEDVQALLSENGDTPNIKSFHSAMFGGSLKPYRTYNILSLYFVTFATYFCFMGLEAALPPVANTMFGWSEVETSYVYLAASVLIIFVVILLRILNSCYSDRVLLLAGLIVMVISYLWLTIVIHLLPTMPAHVGIPLTLTGIAIHVVGLPFAFAYSEALYTKLAPISDMDRAQSIFRTIVNVAFLVGPYVGGTLIDSPTWVFLSMTVISIIPMFLVGYRFRDFVAFDRPASPSGDLETAKES